MFLRNVDVHRRVCTESKPRRLPPSSPPWELVVSQRSTTTWITSFPHSFFTNSLYTFGLGKTLGLHGGEFKMTAFWNIAPWSFVQVDQRFRSMYCLHRRVDRRPDDGSSTYLWNIGLLLRDYRVVYPRRLSSLYLALVLVYCCYKSVLIDSNPVLRSRSHYRYFTSWSHKLFFLVFLLNIHLIKNRFRLRYDVYISCLAPVSCAISRFE
jgi:hypothetical protein